MGCEEVDCIGLSKMPVRTHIPKTSENTTTAGATYRKTFHFFISISLSGSFYSRFF